MLGEPIPVGLQLTDVYTVPHEQFEEEQESSIEPEELFNWAQNSILTIGPAPAGSRLVDANGDPIQGQTANTVKATVYYQIANNPGVKLPESGGPGTTWIYLLGALLVLGTGILLAARWRTRRV